MVVWWRESRMRKGKLFRYGMAIHVTIIHHIYDTLSREASVFRAALRVLVTRLEIHHAIHANAACHTWLFMSYDTLSCGVSVFRAALCVLRTFVSMQYATHVNETCHIYDSLSREASVLLAALRVLGTRLEIHHANAACHTWLFMLYDTLSCEVSVFLAAPRVLGTRLEIHHAIHANAVCHTYDILPHALSLRDFLPLFPLLQKSPIKETIFCKRDP